MSQGALPDVSAPGSYRGYGGLVRAEDSLRKGQLAG